MDRWRLKENVHEWRRQRQEVVVPVTHRTIVREVDFFEVLVGNGGERRKEHILVMRLLHSSETPHGYRYQDEGAPVPTCRCLQDR